MEYRIDVRLSETELYDFMLYHTYSGPVAFFAGALGFGAVLLGIISLITGIYDQRQSLIYIVAGLVFFCLNPLILRVKAHLMIKKNPHYSKSHSYVFSDNGICYGMDTTNDIIGWESITKVVATPKTIGYYYGQDQAAIIPKHSFGNMFTSVVKLTLRHVPQDKIHIPVNYVGK